MSASATPPTLILTQMPVRLTVDYANRCFINSDRVHGAQMTSFDDIEAVGLSVETVVETYRALGFEEMGTQEG